MAVPRALVGDLGGLGRHALTESQIGLYKTEPIRPSGPCRTIDQVEVATLDRVHWFNTERTHESIDNLTPIELEQTSYAQPANLEPAS
ncbi:integrase core domain-containing protein [Luethyella okanaganae]|uniref:Integrase core domain-containing protein n=1 Tax=Luethyella okanaganae TaxID=69372 RepID=A0ABW1VJK4_9MICO